VDSVVPDAIFQVASGFMAAKHLFVAGEVGLFEHLADGPATLNHLALRAGVPPRTLRILADAMVALGFVERQGGQYRNSPVATTFLSGRTPTDLRPFLRFWNQISYPGWLHLETSVRNDQPAIGYLGGALTAEQERTFAEGVEAITAGTAAALATIYDFSRHRRVLDLGGGTGSFLIAALHQHPGLDATLLETPAVAAIARQRLSGDPETRHIAIVEGDFFTEPIPGGHDAVIVANILHLFTPEHNLALLRRIREHIPDSARLLLIDFWTDATHTQPPFAALMAGEFLVADVMLPIGRSGTSAHAPPYTRQSQTRCRSASRYRLFRESRLRPAIPAGGTRLEHG
jgi:SAM-dependent methyltransferase